MSSIFGHSLTPSKPGWLASCAVITKSTVSLCPLQSLRFGFFSFFFPFSFFLFFFVLESEIRPCKNGG